MTVAGGVAFWVADFAISLSPIAAEYRAAFSIFVLFCFNVLLRIFNDFISFSIIIISLVTLNLNLEFEKKENVPYLFVQFLYDCDLVMYVKSAIFQIPN
ncbi:MAG: hypothetical protein KGD67_02805 [Candidatus Lokiarchaeota archaeon]|nr:hypothetical protein [Candidatus Lokiarchaeota archaeon]